MEPKGIFSVIATRTGRLLVVTNEDLSMTRGEVILQTGFTTRYAANAWRERQQEQIDELNGNCQTCGE